MNNQKIKLMRNFDRFKFSLLAYSFFGILVMILLKKITDLQDQLRSVEQQIRFEMVKLVLSYLRSNLIDSQVKRQLQLSSKIFAVLH